jgi:hypothetical protein
MLAGRYTSRGLYAKTRSTAGERVMVTVYQAFGFKLSNREMSPYLVPRYRLSFPISPRFETTLSVL